MCKCVNEAYLESILYKDPGHKICIHFNSVIITRDDTVWRAGVSPHGTAAAS